MMTSKIPKVDDDDLFPVKQTCIILEICKATLLKYESKGYITSVVNQMGRKVFPGRELKRCVSQVRNY